LVRLRVQVKNELHHLAMNQGTTRKRKLWRQAGERVLRELPLAPWASRRREDLFKVKAMLDEHIGALDQAVVQAAEQDERAKLLIVRGVNGVTKPALGTA
jgi:transposase